ncbi:MAG: PaREP1 family protein [Candidatus Njordarchaeales archaeon]
MEVKISLPEALIRKISEHGLDIERVIIEHLINRLELNPDEELVIHAELAEKYFNEGKKLIKEDPVQASEKLYKAVEEAIKALAIVENLEEILKRVRERGRWTVTDLDKAARKLSKKLGKWVLYALSQAWDLHVWGYHEGKLDKEAIEERLPDIEKIINYVKRNVQKH